MVRVDNEMSFSRVSGTNIGGGTFWGLGRLLTGCSSFDEILQLSSHGDNSKVDMLVGDIYGGRDYTSIGLSADTIASSFGKVLHEEPCVPQCFVSVVHRLVYTLVNAIGNFVSFS